MKRILNVILAALIFTFLSSVSKGQSEIEYEPGTVINVTSGANICADVVTINGTYSGDGTKCDAALPVELRSFSAIVKGDKVELTWQTATEVNNYGFEVERSLVIGHQSLENWEVIGFVQGHGNSNSPKDYSFFDACPFGKNSPSGNLKYRLKQIDTDGRYEYYGTMVEVSFSITSVEEKQLPTKYVLEQNYPNPFNPSTKISYSILNSENVLLKVYDVLGKEVKTLVDGYKNSGTYEIEFNAGELTSGFYIYTIISGNFSETRKMILMR
jgi:hypothetical protein